MPYSTDTQTGKQAKQLLIDFLQKEKHTPKELSQLPIPN